MFSDSVKIEGSEPQKGSRTRRIRLGGSSESSDQLSKALTEILKALLSQSFIPLCLKSATIIQLSKKTTISSLNYYPAVALTPFTMMSFEVLIRRLAPNVWPTSYSYRANRSAVDAKITALPTTISHLKQHRCYTWLLFIDISSIFNIIFLDRGTVKLLNIRLHSPPARSEIFSVYREPDWSPSFHSP